MNARRINQTGSGRQTFLVQLWRHYYGFHPCLHCLQCDMKSKWKHRFHAPGGRGSHAKISSHKEDKKENVLASNSKLLNAPCQAYVVKERRKKEKRNRKNSYLRTTIEIRLRIRNCWFLNRMEGNFWRAYKALSSVTKDKVRQEVILHLCPNLEDKLND